MPRRSIFSAMRAILRCAFCRDKNCSVRYLPEGKKVVYYGGARYVSRCYKLRKW